MFINSVDTFKKYVIVGNSFSMQNITTLKPDALLKYFIPLMGQALIDQVESFEIDVNPIKKSSFEKMENALSKFILFDYLVQGQLTIEDGSITRIENDQSKTAFKNQILDAREMLEETALTIMEDLITLFEQNDAIFLLWNSSPAKQNTDKLLIKSAKEFNEIERLFRVNTTFYSLSPTQITCLDLFILSRFDSVLVKEMIDNNALSTEKKIFREYLQKALANFTIATAMEKNLVKFSRDGIRLLQQDNTTASKIEAKADTDLTSKAITKYIDTANRYIDLADKYMNKNLTAFGLTNESQPFIKTRAWM